MFIQKNDSYLQSTLLNTLPGIFHAYSTRTLGDMRKPEPKASFLSLLGGSPHMLATGEQVHGAIVADIAQFPSYTKGADGLITQVASGRAIGVIVADCVPVLLADTNGKMIAIVHAGWKGTIAHIVLSAVNKMVEQGIALQDIRASIGPHIGRCCYAVSEDRARRFLEVFNHDPKVVGVTNGQWYLDIGYANHKELLQAGLAPAQIDAPIVCTSCQVDRFYSFRKDTAESFGEILAVIGVQ